MDKIIGQVKRFFAPTYPISEIYVTGTKHIILFGLISYLEGH
jgi:predicted PhzF superfamily epimerase YddE/YHI9